MSPDLPLAMRMQKNGAIKPKRLKYLQEDKSSRIIITCKNKTTKELPFPHFSSMGFKFPAS